MARYEVHVRINHVEVDRSGEITGFVIPIADVNLIKVRDAQVQINGIRVAIALKFCPAGIIITEDNVEVKIWDTVTGEWVV